MLSIFQDPQASETYGNGTEPEAINNVGAVTGLYADYQGVVHGSTVRRLADTRSSIPKDPSTRCRLRLTAAAR